jgi:hypothetical protein
MVSATVYVTISLIRLECGACGARIECKPVEVRSLAAWVKGHRDPGWAMQWGYAGGVQQWSAEPPELVTSG